MGDPSPADTKARLVTAATELFAARGFHATTVREIAERAGVNVASGHYHYGSKKALYLEVLRAQFARVGRLLEAHHALVPPAGLARLRRRELERLFAARLDTMVDVFLGPGSGPHAQLMQRELCDPSEALPVIVDEFLRPLVDELATILARLAPGLDAATLQQCVFSIAGQVNFHRFALPAVLQLRGLARMPAELPRELAAHVTTFSLGGLDRVARRPRRRRPDAAA